MFSLFLLNTREEKYQAKDGENYFLFHSIFLILNKDFFKEEEASDCVMMYSCLSLSLCPFEE